MSLYPVRWALHCDASGCYESIADETSVGARADARGLGWQLDVKLNGERARRNGKDFCPDHIRSVVAGSVGSESPAGDLDG